MTVHYENRLGAIIVRLDNPPVNAINHSMREALSDVMMRAVEEKATRLIFVGTGRNFVAGADAKEFGTPSKSPHLNDVFRTLAELPIPTIAAINGTALGGGLELALACRYRIAAPDALLGLPEVTLGIVPGAGGTQRLPRLTGLADAYELVAQGKTISAARALQLGIVDRLDADPLLAALKLDEAVLADAVPADARPAPVADPDAERAARQFAARRQPRQLAPEKAIELVTLAAGADQQANLAREREVFLELRSSDQASALRHVFFAERRAMSLGRNYSAPQQSVEQAVVVGGGNMGAGIAYALGSTGLAVTVVETDEKGRERASENVRRLIDQGVSRGVLSGPEAEALGLRFRFAVGYGDLPAAQLAIEAAFEHLDVKHAVFAALEQVMPKDAILATNTSYLDVNEISSQLQHPDRFLGLHFFSPAHVMKLLEIVRADTTSAETLGAALAIAKRLKKIPVLARVCDGFIGNRILTRYRATADLLLLEGALPGDIDAAMEAFGMAMGPYAAQDMSGLDIAYANRQRQPAKARTGARYVPIADRLVEDLERLGRKSAAGWFDYTAGGQATASAVVEKTILAASAAAGIERKILSPQEISRRILLAMIAEAADILDEGIAESPSDIDLVMVHGYGFPRWRGGLMQYADTLGASSLVVQLEELAETDPLSWSIPKLIADLARDSLKFQSLNEIQ
jgi:3-hydroxyacyl-CoA dehydrogenase